MLLFLIHFWNSLRWTFRRRRMIYNDTPPKGSWIFYSLIHFVFCLLNLRRDMANLFYQWDNYRPHPKDGGRYCFQFVCQFTPRLRRDTQPGLDGGGRGECPRKVWMVGGVPWPGLDGGGISQPGLDGGGTPGNPPSTMTGWGTSPHQDCIGTPPPPQPA